MNDTIFYYIRCTALGLTNNKGGSARATVSDLIKHVDKICPNKNWTVVSSQMGPK